MNHTKNRVFKLIGKVQYYAWGGNSFLPQLLHIDNSENNPFAEYWLGAHDNASSEIVINNEERKKLNDYIKSDPSELLGEYVSNKFKRLPYLLKILDVKNMLSIQVHPSKENAEKEFTEENKKSIPLNAFNRNYKDDNHKPELMLALGEFWLLHGFKPKNELIKILKNIPELNFLLNVFGKENYYELYKTVMELDQDIVNEVLQPLLDRIVPQYLNNEFKKDDENFWAARAALTYNEPGKIDRGIFSVYLFNLLKLQKDEAIFQDAGLPHAYLEGQNAEIMANSDNVLRGGLTPKHIDVNELLKHINFEETIPNIIREKKTADYIYSFITSAPDFELSAIRLSENEKVFHTANSTEIFIVLNGNISVEEKNQPSLAIKSGEAFIAFDKAATQIIANEDALIYRASVPFSGS